MPRTFFLTLATAFQATCSTVSISNAFGASFSCRFNLPSSHNGYQTFGALVISRICKKCFQHLSVLELEKELLKHIFFGAILVGEIKVSQGTCQSYWYFRRMPDDLCRNSKQQRHADSRTEIGNSGLTHVHRFG